MTDPEQLLSAGPGLLELTADQLTAEHVGRVLQVASPPMSGLLVAVAQHVASPALPGTGEAIADSTHLVLERPPEAGRARFPFRVPTWIVPEARVVVDLRVEVGVCDLCSQQLLRTPDGDCWHPWHVAVPCPPEPPLAERPAGFASGRPGAQHWRPLRSRGAS